MDQYKELLRDIIELRDNCQAAVMLGGDQQSVVEEIDELFDYFEAVWLGKQETLGYSDLDQLCTLVKSELFSPNVTSESARINVIDAFTPIESRLKQLDEAQDAKLRHANQLLEMFKNRQPPTTDEEFLEEEANNYIVDCNVRELLQDMVTHVVLQDYDEYMANVHIVLQDGNLEVEVYCPNIPEELHWYHRDFD